jgi:hypothetical protein
MVYHVPGTVRWPTVFMMVCTPNDVKVFSCSSEAVPLQSASRDWDSIRQVRSLIVQEVFFRFAIEYFRSRGPIPVEVLEALIITLSQG